MVVAEYGLNRLATGQPPGSAPGRGFPSQPGRAGRFTALLRAAGRRGWFAAVAAGAGCTAVLLAAVLADSLHYGWWLAAAAGMGPLIVAGRWAGAAYQAGRAAERARWLRMLHDTALQSLEAMALASEDDRRAPAETLTRIRADARREAVILRGSLAELTGDGRPAGSLTETLSALVDALRPGSPRVELVGGEPAVALTPFARDVLRDATRAALGNAVRHAGATRVVIRVTGAGAGVEVVIRDDGRGFDTARIAPGFGIRQSIVARLRDAGGTATVESEAGHGTRVRLWMPV